MSTVIVVMASGARHEITLPPDEIAVLFDMLTERWKGKRGPAHSFNRSNGTCVLLNPLFVESIEVG